MGGMGMSSLSNNNPTVVSAFQAALLHQSLVLIALFALLALVWNLLRAAQLRRAGELRPVREAEFAAEPYARRLLRVSFGLLWLFDGLLQAQASMPLGLADGVLTPAGSSSPSFVRSIVSFGALTWDRHPVSAAAAAVWIQVGIGLLLLVAPRGRISRLAGATSALWGLVVWAAGEAFGGILGSGVSILFGAPGAALFYVVAGVAVALPERVFATPRLCRSLLRVLGAMVLVLTVVQAWPANGFWHGGGAQPGALSSMLSDMSSTPQPALSASVVRGFAGVVSAHGFAVNLAVVVVLSLLGATLLLGGARGLRIALLLGLAFCLADWLLVQDLGFLGGVGTDPNSMPPLALVLLAGVLGTRSPSGGFSPARPTIESAAIRRALTERPTFVLRALAAGASVVVVLLGALPMALASANPVADPILAEAIGGMPQQADAPLVDFRLEDEAGRSVTPASFRGKTLVVAFLDPVCTTDCPLIAQELRVADQLLGTDAGRVEFLAVDANPLYRSVSVVRAFDATERLATLSNWHFLTGPVRQLAALWNAYGVQVSVEPGGAMVAHADVALIVDRGGVVRQLISTDPGPASAASRSSFSGLIANAARSEARR
jgi:cytochrome oxidase Cu insertion factor (SCO1/SenC/PrrC family)